MRPPLDPDILRNYRRFLERARHVPDGEEDWQAVLDAGEEMIDDRGLTPGLLAGLDRLRGHYAGTGEEHADMADRYGVSAGQVSEWAGKLSAEAGVDPNFHASRGRERLRGDLLDRLRVRPHTAAELTGTFDLDQRVNDYLGPLSGIAFTQEPAGVGAGSVSVWYREEDRGSAAVYREARLADARRRAGDPSYAATVDRFADGLADHGMLPSEDWAADRRDLDDRVADLEPQHATRLRDRFPAIRDALVAYDGPSRFRSEYLVDGADDPDTEAREYGIALGRMAELDLIVYTGSPRKYDPSSCDEADIHALEIALDITETG